MATNTGKGHRRGQQKNRFQLFNKLTKLWDKYDGNANYIKSKKSPGPFIVAPGSVIDGREYRTSHGRPFHELQTYLRPPRP